MNQGVFLALKRGKQALRGRIRRQLGDLGGEGQGDQNRDPNDELAPLGDELGKPIQGFLASGHERVCLVGAGSQGSSDRLDSPARQGYHPRPYGEDIRVANHASAKKRVRQTVKRTARNRHIRTYVRTCVKRVRAAVEAGDSSAAKKALIEADEPYRRRGVEGHLPSQDRLAVHLQADPPGQLASGLTPPAYAGPRPVSE